MTLFVRHLPSRGQRSLFLQLHRFWELSGSLRSLRIFRLWFLIMLPMLLVQLYNYTAIRLFSLAYSFIKSIWLQSSKSSLPKYFPYTKGFLFSFDSHVALLNLLDDSNYCIIVKVVRETRVTTLRLYIYIFRSAYLCIEHSYDK